MGGTKKQFVVESAITCQECNAEGSVCVFPKSELSEAERIAQRLANPVEELIGLRTMALCPNCRRNIRKEQGIEVVVAEDFVRMRAKYKPVERVGAVYETSLNPTLAALQKRFGL